MTSHGGRASAKSGPEFYDDADVFAAYCTTRTGQGDLNARVEVPAVESIVGDVSGLAILELGCGDASYGATLLSRGATSYVGIDGSRLMLDAARERLAQISAASLVLQCLEDWESQAEQFDLVISRMALHYVEDYQSVLHRIRHCLRPGGRLVISVEHPVVTSHYASNLSGGVPRAWSITDYFVAGPRTSSWLGSRVVKFHRSIEEWLAGLTIAGFALSTLQEGDPRRLPAQNLIQEIDDPRRFVPMYLILATQPI